MFNVEGAEVGHSGRRRQRLFRIRHMHDYNRASFSNRVAVSAFGSRWDAGSQQARAESLELRKQSDASGRVVVFVFHVDVEICLGLKMNVVTGQAGTNHLGDCTQSELPILEGTKNRIHEYESAPSLMACQGRRLGWLSKWGSSKLYAITHKDSVNKRRCVFDMKSKHAGCVHAESRSGTSNHQ